MAPLRTARVEEKIVKVPQDEISIAFVGPKAGTAAGVDLEKNSTIDQKAEKLHTGRSIQGLQLSDLSRSCEEEKGGRNFRVVDPEQRTGTRRFQHHLVAAPAQVSEPGEDNDICATECRHSRPIVRNLRLDDDEVLGFWGAREAVFQQTVPRQLLDQ